MVGNRKYKGLIRGNSGGYAYFLDLINFIITANFTYKIFTDFYKSGNILLRLSNSIFLLLNFNIVNNI